MYNKFVVIATVASTVSMCTISTVFCSMEYGEFTPNCIYKFQTFKTMWVKRKPPNGFITRSSVSNTEIWSFLIIFTQISVPWDTQTPFGYFSELCFHIMMGSTYMVVNATFLLLFASLCLLHRAFYQRLRHSLRKFDQFDGNRNEKHSFCEIIRFHNSVKRWADILNPDFFEQTLLCKNNFPIFPSKFLSAISRIV